MKWKATTIGLICLSLTACFSDKEQANTKRIFLNANVIDTSSNDITLKHITVVDGKITAIDTQIPASKSADIVDLKHQYVLPGFIDMHVHSWGNQSLQDNYQWIGTQGTLRASLYAGVFAVLDLFSDEDDILSFRDEQRPKAAQAHLFAAGPCLTATNGHCSQYGTPTRIVDTPEQAMLQVYDLAPKQPDVIKVVYDHVDYGERTRPTIDLETLQAVVEAAKTVGIKSVVHIGTWQDVRDAALAGADMVTHIPMNKMPEDIPAVMMANNTAIIPTLTVQSEWPVATQASGYFDNLMLKAVTTPELLADYQTDLNAPRFQRFKTYLDKRLEEDAYSHMDSAMKALHEAGVNILVGTDAGNLLAFHGYSFHREMQQLKESGMNSWDILDAATLKAAEMLGADWGIKIDTHASFLVLSESPVEDIRNTESITMLVKHGCVVDRQALQASINPTFLEKIGMYLTGW